MITLREVFTGLYGAYRLLRLDRQGSMYFDKTLQGFWKSFFAAAIVLPFYVILIALRFGEEGLSTDPFRYVTMEMSVYVIAWVAFPLAMLPFSRQFDREENYLGFIVAYNWASVIQNAIYLPIAMIVLMDVMPSNYGHMISFIALAFIMVYTWFIARVVLDVSVGVAIAVVGMDIFLSVLIRSFSEGILRT